MRALLACTAARNSQWMQAVPVVPVGVSRTPHCGYSPLTPPPPPPPIPTHLLQSMPLPLHALIATLALLAAPAPAIPLPVLMAPILLPQRQPRVKTGTFRWLVEDAPDDEWRVHFRVSRETFQYIVDSIAHLPCFRVRPQNMHNAVSVERQVAAFLFRAGSMSVCARETRLISGSTPSASARSA